MHHVMIGDRSQNHSADRKPSPKYQQPHGTKIGGDAADFQNSHHPFFGHHRSYLRKRQAAQNFAGIFADGNHVVAQSCHVYAFAEFYRLFTLQRVARIRDRRTDFPLLIVVENLGAVCHQNVTDNILYPVRVLQLPNHWHNIGTVVV